MKKVAVGLALFLACSGISYADESPVERGVNTAVQGTKNILGYGLSAVHVVFHGVETVLGIGIDLTHSGLKALEIPFTNGKPLVDEG